MSGQDDIGTILYILPKPDFFAQGLRGRVAHAAGVVSGMRAAGVGMVVASGPGVRQFFGDDVRIELEEVEFEGGGPLAARRWLARLIERLDRRLSSDRRIGAVIVRYAVSNGGRWPALMRRHADRVWCFEVNSLAYHQYHRLPMPLRRLLRWFETRVLVAADVVYVVSAPLGDDICASRAGLRDRIVVVPNGGPIRSEPQLSLQHAGAGIPAAQAPVRFTFLGVFQPYYEFDLVVRAFRALRRSGVAAELHFHGYGPGYGPLAAACSSDPDIHFHGPYELAQLIREGGLRDTTVLLLPNRAAGMSEIGSPIKLYEYMTLGRPIIAADVGQAGTVLEHGRTGLLYTAGEVGSCTDAMRLALVPELRARLARAAWQDFLQNHSWAARMRTLHRALSVTPAKQPI